MQPRRPGLPAPLDRAAARRNAQARRSSPTPPSRSPCRPATCSPGRRVWTGSFPTTRPWRGGRDRAGRGPDRAAGLYRALRVEGPREHRGGHQRLDTREHGADRGHAAGREPCRGARRRRGSRSVSPASSSPSACALRCSPPRARALPRDDVLAVALGIVALREADLPAARRRRVRGRDAARAHPPGMDRGAGRHQLRDGQPRGCRLRRVHVLPDARRGARREDVPRPRHAPRTAARLPDGGPGAEPAEHPHHLGHHRPAHDRRLRGPGRALQRRRGLRLRRVGRRRAAASRRAVARRVHRRARVRRIPRQRAHPATTQGT